MHTFELRVVDPATGRPTWVLGDTETWTISPVISDAGTVQFTYPKNGANYNQIIMDRDVAVFYNGVEIGPLRSTMEQRSYNDADVAEEGAIAQITCRTSMARMQRAVVYPQNWPTTSNPPNYAFTSNTPGFIVRTLVQAAQARGTILEIDISSFTDTHDSNGVAWATSISLTWDAQTTYLQVIQDLQTYGQCDAVMNVYSLKLYNYQTAGVDRTTQNPPVIIRKGRDLSESSVQESTRDLSTVVLASGASNLYAESFYAPGVAARGRREVGTSVSGITDILQLVQTGDAVAESASADVIARTNALVFGDPNSPVPSVDFDLGDWVFTEIDGQLFRQRVLQYSVAEDNEGVLTGTSALDNIFGEFLTRLQAQVAAIENGSTITGASEPDKVEVIKNPPAIPATVGAGSTAYLDDQGNTLAEITLTWSAVTEDTAGNLDDNIAGYQVQVTIHGTTNWTTYACDANTFSLYIYALLPNTAYDYRVQCYDSQANYSGWTATQTITTASDTTAPTEPSTPVVSSTLGQLSVVWDGLDNTGHTMPLDFDHLSVYVSSSSPSFTPSAANLFQNMRGGGTVTVPGAVLTYGTTYYVRFVAYDRTGNASIPSAAGSATLSQVVAVDIASGQVSISNLAFSDVGNLIDNGSFEDVNWRATRNTAFGGSHWSFDNTTSSAGTWSATHFGTAGQTNETVVLNTVNCTVGQTFMGAADWKLNSSVTSSAMRVALGVNFYDITGSSLGYSDLSFCWTAPSTNDNTWRSRISTQAVTAPAGAVTARFVLATSGHTAGQVWMDNVEVRMQQDNLLIANAAITDAKIGTVSANKIIAGTMSAGVIISGSIGTAASGQRCVADGTGFHAYDASGNMVFDVNNFSTAMTLSAQSGSAKIVVNAQDTTMSPGLFGNQIGGGGAATAVYPTLRMFDSSNSNSSVLTTAAVGGNSAGVSLMSGSFTQSTKTYAYQLLMADQFGSSYRCIDYTNEVANGGLVYIGPTFAVIGTFIEGALHGGQLRFDYDSGSTDSRWEIDGYLPNWNSAFAQFGIITGDISGLGGGSGGANIAYGPTPYSTMVPTVNYSCGTLGQIGGNVNALTSTGFAFTLGGTSPASWSIIFWGWRIR